MTGALLRIVLALSVVALTLPMRAAPAPPQAQAKCCMHLQAQQAKHDGRCGGDSSKSQDRDQGCCAACALGLSLILTPPRPLIFRPDNGEKLIANSVAQYFRSDRPPVPPPRAALA